MATADNTMTTNRKWAPRRVEEHRGLSLSDVGHTYPGGATALRDVTLRVNEGEFISLLGPSGSGKTTLLMAIAGFVRPTTGTIVADGVEITDRAPQHRNFGVVFQNYALFPHMSVLKNVVYPLVARRVTKATRQKRALDSLELVGLRDLAHRRPAQLSGGQQQRVALARALVYDPSVLLLDEPLGALDRALRERMKGELRRLHQTVGVTLVYVTHDQDEALSMSDRVAVIHNGIIEQVGSPVEIYSRPATTFVASFVGEANLLPVEIMELRKGHAHCRMGGKDPMIVPCGPVQDPQDMRGLMMLRPEDVKIAPSAPPPNVPDGPANTWISVTGHLRDVEYRGRSWHYEVDLGNAVISAESTSRQELATGQTVHAMWDSHTTWLVCDG